MRLEEVGISVMFLCLIGAVSILFDSLIIDQAVNTVDSVSHNSHNVHKQDSERKPINP